MFFESCLKKQADLEALFCSCHDRELLYKKIMELGKNLPSYPADLKTAEYMVAGCQSQMYLACSYSDQKIFFQAYSDALISAGLAAILIIIYNGESAETILKCPPTVLQKLNIPSFLTPNRASGLASILLRMKQEALKALSYPNNLKNWIWADAKAPSIERS